VRPGSGVDGDWAVIDGDLRQLDDSRVCGERMQKWREAESHARNEGYERNSIFFFYFFKK